MDRPHGLDKTNWFCILLVRLELVSKKSTRCEFNRSRECPLPREIPLPGNEGIFIATVCPARDDSFWIPVQFWLAGASAKGLSLMPDDVEGSLPAVLRFCEVSICFKLDGARDRINEYLKTGKMRQWLCDELLMAYARWCTNKATDRKDGGG